MVTSSLLVPLSPGRLLYRRQVCGQGRQERTVHGEESIIQGRFHLLLLLRRRRQGGRGAGG